MRILSIDEAPLCSVAYDNVAPDLHIERCSLDLRCARVDHLPKDLDGVLAAADLQGRAPRRTPEELPRLLGELLADEVAALGERDEAPPASRVGVLLAGDMFARVKRRGGHGDVRPVWRAFAQRYQWVAGVPGNHDLLGESPRVSRIDEFTREAGIHVLDGTAARLNGLTVAGVAGTIGNPRRPFRRDGDDFLGAVLDALAHEPDVLVMHDGPDVPDAGLEGIPEVRELIESAPPMLVIRGHRHWEPPLATLDNGTQVLNVHSRAVLLTAH